MTFVEATQSQLHSNFIFSVWALHLNEETVAKLRDLWGNIKSSKSLQPILHSHDLRWLKF